MNKNRYMARNISKGTYNGNGPQSFEVWTYDGKPDERGLEGVVFVCWAQAPAKTQERHLISHWIKNKKN